ncbi:MAG: hypothetical protein N3E45_12060 [Oscillatoriaceae bacterium SKW80]|nr:hypothetical protein [Oscillatoriaceae bacterium SKYG93]MCX8121538.1 hypothetical protein [Oscillatoriaceae bacterium SKW80]MDW8452876.1 hypothetical protein [Oscillatoriaceae cyanobacterium SKYGB_i_bin93]HIK27883.1 hypothetical protein [Oscillatoriaceae cyanobacterium M7585_C2015_266]
MANKLDQSPTPESGNIVGMSTDSYHQPTAAMSEQSTETINNLEKETTPESSPKKDSGLGLPLLWLSMLLVFGGTATSAFLWLITMPPPVNCQNITPLSPDMERLHCAQQSAATRKLEKLLEGLNLVKDWPEENPLYSQAAQLRDQWSRSLLELAQQKMDAGDIKSAREIASKIPPNASVYKEGQAVVGVWQNDWERGETIYNKALQALKNQQWQQATAYAQELSRLRNEYWRQQRLTELIKQISAEKEGWRKLREARNLASYETPADLEEAIALIGKISPSTYVYATAKSEMTKWSRKLLAAAAKRLEEKDYEGAIAIAKKIPSESTLYPEAQDFIQLSTANMILPETAVSSMPFAVHIFALMEAQAAARKIEPNRPLYKEAQTKISDWQEQIKDFLQLQVASILANVGQGLTLQLAIDQAQQIGKNRPKRLHAQTLIAQWRKELAVAQDRPFIVSAQMLAAKETPEGLRSALAQARQVAPGRPLRLEAQTLIASWNKRVEILEDQPILDEAKSLAKQGELKKAILTAEKIKPNRALYAQAQQAIADWTYQIQVKEDRPILEEATKLAAQGRLFEAIQKASQIAYGRALYYEAQEGIARWSAERDAYLRAQEAAVARDTYSPPAYSPPQEAYAAPAEPYYPPQENYAAPAEPYYPPPQETYTAPAKPYYPPQETYTEPAEPYYPPQETYTAPAEPYYPPAEAPPARAEAPAPEPPPATEPPAAAEPLPIDGIE